MSKLPEVPFYVKDWLPKRGKSMLYGPRKTGKSYLCLQLARCIGSGEDFLGLPTRQGKVLYVQFELGEEILQHRMREETKKDYADVFVGTDFSMKLDKEVGKQRLWRALEAVEPDVLILDPKIKMISGDENVAHDMQVVCDYLDGLIEAFHCSIFVMDHSGKDITKGGRGSNVWEGWVDSYLEMKRTSKRGEQLKVKITPMALRHASLPPNPIEAELGDDFEFHLIGETMTVKKQVLEFIQKAKREVEPAHIFAKRIGSNTSVYKALKQLVEEDLVEKTGRGAYRAK
jgi:RecA-family ATPase